VSPADPSSPHALFPQQTSIERARHAFLVELKRELFSQVRSRLTRPDSEHYAWFSALARAQHEQTVDSTAACVERQADRLCERYRQCRAGSARGSLRLDPGLPVPRYQAAFDAHCVPGSYFFEGCEDDVAAAARYELGISLYTLGRHGELNDSKAQAALGFLRERHASLMPADILDLGCSCGNSTLPYADAFPQATVVGIDLAAPMLRYAHARAEALGRVVQFEQANAEQLRFATASFDLVVSHILLHETSRQAVQRIFSECQRVLRPGGIMLHVEVPVRHDGLEGVELALADWDTENNNEPFWRGLQQTDLRQLAARAGFAAERYFDEDFDAGQRAFLNNRPWRVIGAIKASS